MNGGDHSHSHGHNHSVGHSHLAPARNRRVLWLVLALNGIFLVVEFSGGLLFGSLALLADAVHMLSDVAALAIALVATALVSRPRSKRHTFGLLRSEVLAAQANGVLLFAAGVWVLVESARRIGDPPETQGLGVLGVAAVGLAINLGSAWLLHGSRHDNLNMRGAYLHMLADAAGSVAAIVAGAAALASAFWVDPLVSAVVGVMVLWSAYSLLRQTTHVLLEGAPDHIDSDEISAALLDAPEVVEVHHLHLWFLASDTVALSGHVVLDGEPPLHTAQVVGDRLKADLRERFGIGHATLELECHACEPDPADCQPTSTE